MIMRALGSVNERQLRKVNLSVEELCGCLFNLGDKLLMEHADDPQTLEIRGARDLVNFKEKVINEMHAMFKNINLYCELYAFYNQASEVYFLLA
jgi:hypothetical protein